MSEGEGPQPSPADTGAEKKPTPEPHKPGPDAPTAPPDRDTSPAQPAAEPDSEPSAASESTIDPLGTDAEGGTQTDGDDAKDILTPIDEKRSRRAVEKILDIRAAEVKAQVKASGRDEATPTEAALIYAGSYPNGFDSLKPGKPISVYGDALQVKVDDEEMTVSSISRQEKNADGVEFMCTVDGKSELVKIKGSELAAAHNKKYAGEIADNFDDPTQKELVTLYAEGKEISSKMTRDQLDTMEATEPTKRPTVEAREGSSVSQAAIENQLKRISGEITRMRGLAEEASKKEGTAVDVSQNPDYRVLSALQAALENAKAAEGSVGAIVRQGALELVREHARASGTRQIDVESILNSDTSTGKQFSIEVTNAEKEAKEFFDKKGIPPEKQEEYMKALKDPQEFCKLILDTKDEAFTKISEELADQIYGNLSDDEVNRLYQNIIDSNYNLDAETKSKIDKLKGVSKKAGLIALILAAIPAAAAGIAAAAAFQTVGAAGKITA